MNKIKTKFLISNFFQSQTKQFGYFLLFTMLAIQLHGMESTEKTEISAYKDKLSIYEKRAKPQKKKAITRLAEFANTDIFE